MRRSSPHVPPPTPFSAGPTTARKPSPLARGIVVGALVLYFAILAFSTRFTSYDRFWTELGVPAMTPGYADLRVVLAGLEGQRLGLDVCKDNATDRWKRPFNYPRIWLALSRTGLDQSHTGLIGLGLGAVFLLCALGMVGPLTWKQGLFTAAILCSPVTMLAIERANTDLLMFVLLCCALWLGRRPGSPAQWTAHALWLLAAVLKLFPVFAWLALIGRGRRFFLQFLAGAGLLFLAYLACTFDDLRMIAANTQQGVLFCYGSSLICCHLAAVLANMQWIQIDAGTAQACRMVGLLLLLPVGIAVYWRARRIPWPAGPGPEEDSLALDAFRAGAAIYLGTFALGTNWDYRMIFLILTLPQCWRWTDPASPARHAARAALGTILVAMNWHLFSGEMSFRQNFANGIVQWTLLGLLAYLLVQTLPSLWRRLLKLPGASPVA